MIRTGVAVLRDSIGKDAGVQGERGGQDDGADGTRARRPEPVASGVAVAVTLAVIGLNGAANWAPVLAPGLPEVKIPPVVAVEPLPATPPVPFPPPPLPRGPKAGEPGDEAAPPPAQTTGVVAVDPD